MIKRINGTWFEFHHLGLPEGKYFNPKKTVVIGYRAFEENANIEIENIKTMGVTVYTTNDLKEFGINRIFDEAFKIATKDTSGLHISFDLDVIDPNVAPGVSVPEINGITRNETKEITNYLKNKKELIKSFDLVEYNPLNDQDEKTLEIALEIITQIIKK